MNRQRNAHKNTVCTTDIPPATSGGGELTNASRPPMRRARERRAQSEKNRQNLTDSVPRLDFLFASLQKMLNRASNPARKHPALSPAHPRFPPPPNFVPTKLARRHSKNSNFQKAFLIFSAQNVKNYTSPNEKKTE